MARLAEGALGGLMIVAVLGLGLFQLGAGWVGIEHEFGWGWALAAAVAAGLRFTLPLTYGVYLCAHNVWGWGVLPSLVLALPGVALMIPGLLLAVAQLLRRR
jgi:hypothetical protein